MAFMERICFQGDLKSRLSVDEYHRRFYVFVALLIGVPILLFYAIWGFYQFDNPWLAVPDFTMAVVGIVFALFLRRLKNASPLYRFAAATLSSLMIFNVTRGFYEGGDLLWLYIFPIIMFSIFGTREGLFWVIPVIFICSLLIVFSEELRLAPLPPDVRFQFIISVVLTSVLAYLLESVRANFYRQLMVQKAELEQALESIETLSGLVPICSTCKKIRNDKGYWQKLETYLTEHTKARFSHGICLDCLRTAEPDLYREMVESGEIAVSDRITPVSLRRPESP